MPSTSSFLGTTSWSTLSWGGGGARCTLQWDPVRAGTIAMETPGHFAPWDTRPGSRLQTPQLCEGCSAGETEAFLPFPPLPRLLPHPPDTRPPVHPSGSSTAETESAAPSEGIIKVQRLWRGPGSVEQVFNFKLTRLGACAVGSPIGKMDGWPGSPAGEQDRRGQRGRTGRGDGLCSLQTQAVSISPHRPEMRTATEAPGQPPTRQGTRKKPCRASLLPRATKHPGGQRGS